MKTMKLKWLDRSLLRSPVFYTLATSQKILDAELKKQGFKGDMTGVNDGKGATTQFMTGPQGVSALVCIFDHSHEPEQIYSLLAHEAVHIFQEIKDRMGEKSPSVEFEAYSIQAICQNLFYEYNRQMRGKRGKRTR
jgi:hypothetical protein